MLTHLYILITMRIVPNILPFSKNAGKACAGYSRNTHPHSHTDDCVLVEFMVSCVSMLLVLLLDV